MKPNWICKKGMSQENTYYLVSGPHTTSICTYPIFLRKQMNSVEIIPAVRYKRGTSEKISHYDANRDIELWHECKETE